jgi:hypothetical protein
VTDVIRWRSGTVQSRRREWNGAVEIDVRVGEDTLRALAYPALVGSPEPGVPPQPRGDADGGRLLGFEVDVGQGVLTPGDPVAGFGVEHAGGADLQRHAQVAQLGLVPFELALERVVFA